MSQQMSARYDMRGHTGRSSGVVKSHNVGSSGAGPRVNKKKSLPVGDLSRVFVERSCSTFAIWAPPPVVASFRVSLRNYLLTDDVTFVKRAKHVVLWFRAKYLRTPVEDNGFVLEGACWRWVKKRLGRFCRTNTFLWNSVFNFKNLSLPVTRPVVKQNLEQHWEGVQKADTASTEDCHAAVESIRELLDEVAEKVARKFKKASNNLFSEIIGGTPASNKASYATPQSCFGEVGELYREVFYTWKHDCHIDSWPRLDRETGLEHGAGPHSWDPDVFESRMEQCDLRMPGPLPVMSPVGQTVLPQRPVFDEDSVFDRKLLSALVTWELVCGVNDCGEEFNRWIWEPKKEEGVTTSQVQALMNQKWVHDTFDHRYHEAFLNACYGEDPEVVRILNQHGDHCDDIEQKSYPESRAYFDYWTKRLLEKSVGADGFPDCRVVAVCEPLKVRVITVSDAITNYYSTWYQKTVHGILKKYVCFELLGKAPFSTIIQDIAANSFGDGDLFFDSSDFSGASNGTPALFRELILEGCTKKLPALQRRIQEVCNGQHWIHYPRWTQLPPVLQVQGTLMGRKTSFPILSLQVLATHVWALRLCGDRRPLKQILRGVKINGDDRVTRYTREAHTQFWQCCNRLQFGESKGKSYFHATYANINSQSYHYSEVRELSGWDGEKPIYKITKPYSRKVGSLYCGLLHGQKKLATDVFDPTAVITTLMDSCETVNMQHKVLKTFLKLHKKALKAQACDRNLFLPEVLGGCGQKAPLNWRWNVTRDQARLASFLWEKDEFLWDCRIPVGPLLEILPPTREVWDVQGVKTYWEQVRQLQDGDGEQTVPLSAKEKADHKAWLHDQDLKVNDMLKTKFIRNCRPRRLPLRRVKHDIRDDGDLFASKCTPTGPQWLHSSLRKPDWDSEFRESFGYVQFPVLTKPMSELQRLVAASNLIPRRSHWVPDAHEQEDRRVVVPLTGTAFFVKVYRLGG